MATTKAIATITGTITKGLQALRLAGLYVLQVLVRVSDLLVPRSFSRVETTPFIDPSQFDWHQDVLAEFPKVQAELKALLSVPGTIPVHHEIIEPAAAIAGDNGWLSYFFCVYGQRFEQQRGECPNTARLLDQIPGMKTAFFSILTPGKKIPPHRGPYRGVMRYHLPLIVPKSGQCAIRVGDEIASYEEGVVLMFDDTYEHEVWNDTEETRVVLFLDIARPMKFPFNIVNAAVIGLIGWSPTVRKIRKNQAAFDRRAKKHAPTPCMQN